MKPTSHRYYERLGSRLAELRETRGFTQGEVGRKLGVSQQAVYAYEHGQRHISVVTLDQLATLYGLSMEELIGRVPERRAPKRRLSPRAMRHAERIQAMSKTAQRFVVRIIDHIEATGWYAPKRESRLSNPREG